MKIRPSTENVKASLFTSMRRVVTTTVLREWEGLKSPFIPTLAFLSHLLYAFHSPPALCLTHSTILASYCRGVHCSFAACNSLLCGLYVFSAISSNKPSNICINVMESYPAFLPATGFYRDINQNTNG